MWPFLSTKTDNIRIRIVLHDAVQMGIVEISKKFSSISKNYSLKAILSELLSDYFIRVESSTLVSNNSEMKIVATLEWVT